MGEIVSRETIDRLKHYHHLLETWQKKLNLVSSSTLNNAWERHFLDSLQLLPYLPNDAKTLIDLGSGAGFPGLVLAISRPETLSVTLIESDFKKCVFLENVSRETFSPVKILCQRIESLTDPIKADIITARGLTSLKQLFEYSFPLMTETSLCLFLKGKDFEREIAEAERNWNFDLEIFPSLTDSEARIVMIKNLKRSGSNDKNNFDR